MPASKIYIFFFGFPPYFGILKIILVFDWFLFYFLAKGTLYNTKSIKLATFVFKDIVFKTSSKRSISSRRRAGKIFFVYFSVVLYFFFSSSKMFSKFWHCAKSSFSEHFFIFVFMVSQHVSLPQRWWFSFLVPYGLVKSFSQQTPFCSQNPSVAS